MHTTMERLFKAIDGLIVARTRELYAQLYRPSDIREAEKESHYAEQHLRYELDGLIRAVQAIEQAKK